MIVCMFVCSIFLFVSFIRYCLFVCLFKSMLFLLLLLVVVVVVVVLFVEALSFDVCLLVVCWLFVVYLVVVGWLFVVRLWSRRQSRA